MGGMVTAYFLLQYFPIVSDCLVHNQVQQGAQALVAGSEAQGHPATPWAVRLCLAVHRFPCRPGLFPVRRIRVLPRQHPFPGFAGLVNIGAITLVYAVNAFCVYTMLYGRKPNRIRAARGSRAHDRSCRKGQRLLVHRRSWCTCRSTSRSGCCIWRSGNPSPSVLGPLRSADGLYAPAQVEANGSGSAGD